MQATSPLHFVMDGLTKRPKHIPSHYLYDAIGSALFKSITEQPEYYLSACEAEVLQTYGQKITQDLEKSPFDLVELGCGDGEKAVLLLERLWPDQQLTFVPIDISGSALSALSKRMRSKFPSLRIKPMEVEYFDGLNMLHESPGRRMVMFLGSNIGNMIPSLQIDFLKHLRQTLNPQDRLLIGFDLQKDPDVLMRACDDRAGITRQFNFNVLFRLNREFGADFDPSCFRHLPTYNPSLGAMQSFLISTRKQLVRFKKDDTVLDLEQWEAIHVEDSFKFTPAQTCDLAIATGFTVLH